MRLLSPPLLHSRATVVPTRVRALGQRWSYVSGKNALNLGSRAESTNMIDLDSSSAFDELEHGAYAAPTGIARPAKQSTSASNDHFSEKIPVSSVSRVPPPWFVELVLILD